MSYGTAIKDFLDSARIGVVICKWSPGETQRVTDELDGRFAKYCILYACLQVASGTRARDIFDGGSGMQQGPDFRCNDDLISQGTFGLGRTGQCGSGGG
jgi:hypothetical protein